MTPALKGVHCATVDDLVNWAPDGDEMCVWLELSIGPADGDAADLFQVCIATQSGLKAAPRSIKARDGVKARPIVLREYSWGAVQGAIRNRLGSCSGADWTEIQQKLRRQFDWVHEKQKSV
ncbi:MAG TPA: Imm8 family immunity protein [Polyangia bacterium]